MKDLIREYYRLFVHESAQRFTIAHLDNSEIKYPHQKEYLTESDLISSINGEKSLGLILCQDKTGVTKSGCIDIDVDRDAKTLTEALTIAQKIVKEGSELGINLYIEYSGNRGFHIWLFVEKAITPKLIKNCLKSIALRANFIPEEIYPKDVKSNIKLPCTTHLKTGKRCGFIGSNFDVNNPEIDLEAQSDLMAKFEVTALDKLINLASELESKEKNITEARSNSNNSNESRSKEEIKGLLDSLGDHPSCIKHLLNNGAPLEIDYNQVNLTLIRYCLTKGYSLNESLPLAETMAKNTSEAHSTSKDFRGKVENFKSAYNSASRNSDNYLFGCSYILSGIKEGEAHIRGCIGTKCLIHKNYDRSNSKNKTESSNSKENSGADTENIGSTSEMPDYLPINQVIFEVMVNLSNEDKELVKSQILRQWEKVNLRDYLTFTITRNESIKLMESEVLAYFLQNPEALIDYVDIFPKAFKCTVSNDDLKISDYLEYLYSLKIPSPETIEEYLNEIREKGIKSEAREKFNHYQSKLKADTSSIEVLSQSIEDTETLLNRSISETNLLPTSEKIEGLLTQLLSEDREAIPTFSDDFNYLLNGGFSKGRFYVMSAGPASGKSTLCLQCADFASSKGYKVGYFSFEMSLDQIFITQIARLGEINSGYLDKKIYLKNDSLKLKMFKTVKDYYEQISENIYIIECDDSYTPNKILSVIKKLKLDLVFIDYLQLMQCGDKEIDTNGNETIKVSKIATELKRLSRKSDIPIVAISDINKNAFDNAKSGKKSLDMSALRDSFKIAHSADCVMLLHSSDFDNKGENQEIKTQLDYVKKYWEKIDLKVSSYLKSLDNSTFLSKATADIFSRLFIDKNRTGRTGDILFKYSKAIHKFEPLNYLHIINDNQGEEF